MKTAYIDLIKHALGLGCTISVWDGGAWQVKRSTSYKAIKDAIESVEEAQLRIRDSEGNNIGWALVIPYGVEPDETVADFSGEFVYTWWDKFSPQFVYDF